MTELGLEYTDDENIGLIFGPEGSGLEPTCVEAVADFFQG